MNLDCMPEFLIFNRASVASEKFLEKIRGKSCSPIEMECNNQGRGDGPEAGTSGASEAARANCRLGSPGILPPPREIFKKFRNFKCLIVRFSA